VSNEMAEATQVLVRSRAQFGGRELGLRVMNTRDESPVSPSPLPPALALH